MTLRLLALRAACCLVVCVVAGGLGRGADTLTAKWDNGKAESTKATDANKLTTVTDTVTNSEVNPPYDYDFAWTSEVTAKWSGWVDAGKSKSASWNTTSVVAASKQGGISIDWFLFGCNHGNTNNIAQRWIPAAKGGGCSGSGEGDCALAAKGVAPRVAMAMTLFGEQRSDGDLDFRIESRLIDLTGVGNYIGLGRYLIMLSVFNNTDSDGAFTDEDGNSVTVKAGASRFILGFATDDDTVEEVHQVYEITFALGNGRQVQTSQRAHYWRVRQEVPVSPFAECRR